MEVLSKKSTIMHKFGVYFHFFYVVLVIIHKRNYQRGILESRNEVLGPLLDTFKYIYWANPQLCYRLRTLFNLFSIKNRHKYYKRNIFVCLNTSSILESLIYYWIINRNFSLYCIEVIQFCIKEFPLFKSYISLSIIL